jgi:hypothetical protein
MKKLYLATKNYDAKKANFIKEGLQQMPGIKKDKNGLYILFH